MAGGRHTDPVPASAWSARGAGGVALGQPGRQVALVARAGLERADPQADDAHAVLVAEVGAERLAERLRDAVVAVRPDRHLRRRADAALLVDAGRVVARGEDDL